MRRPLTTAGFHAGALVIGATPALDGTAEGITSIARTGGGAANGDYTITLDPAWAITRSQCAINVSFLTEDLAHPFSESITFLTSTTIQIRTISNGAPADCNFSFAIFRIRELH